MRNYLTTLTVGVILGVVLTRATTSVSTQARVRGFTFTPFRDKPATPEGHTPKRRYYVNGREADEFEYNKFMMSLIDDDPENF